jgi:UDP-2-acetamido-3-amino-2,3-dideoxy-glucuronate N-acetyltransferase
VGSSPLRLALVGAGPWGMALYNTIATTNLASVVLVCTSSGRAPQNVAAELSDDWMMAVDRSDIDGIVVAATAAVQAQILRTAIDRGKPILVEKPLSGSLGDALDVQRLVRASGSLVLVDHTHTFSPAFVRLKELARNSAILSLESRGERWGPFRADISPLWDFAPHDVSMCLQLLGERPTDIRVLEFARTHVQEGIAERISFSLTFPSGISATITVGNSAPEKCRRFLCSTDQGYLIYDDLKDSKLVIRRDESGGFSQPISISDERPLACVVKTFVSGIRGKSRDAFGVDLGVDVVRILDVIDSQLTRFEAGNNQ